MNSLHEATVRLAQRMLGSEESLQTDFYLIMGFFLVFFFFMAAVFEKCKPAYGHETAASIILGIVFSFVFYWIHGENENDFFVFQFRP